MKTHKELADIIDTVVDLINKPLEIKGKAQPYTYLEFVKGEGYKGTRKTIGSVPLPTSNMLVSQKESVLYPTHQLRLDELVEISWAPRKAAIDLENVDMLLFYINNNKPTISDLLTSASISANSMVATFANKACSYDIRFSNNNSIPTKKFKNRELTLRKIDSSFLQRLSNNTIPFHILSEVMYCKGNEINSKEIAQQSVRIMLEPYRQDFTHGECVVTETKFENDIKKVLHTHKYDLVKFRRKVIDFLEDNKFFKYNPKL